MEINDQNLAALGNYLTQTLSTSAEGRQQAEHFLRECEKEQGYALLLLTSMDRADTDLTIRTAASITFKNLVKRCWEQNDKLSESDRSQVKSHIVELMLKTPQSIQRQLSEAITMIGRVDFHEKWTNLLPEICTHIQSDDFTRVNGCLSTCHSLFKRYRYEFKSNELWVEIKYVLDSFAAPLTELFKKVMNIINTPHIPNDKLKMLYSCLALTAKVFYSLNYQDLPEYFEDHISVWMDGFHALLTAPNIPILESDTDDQAGVQETLKAQICEIVSMYAVKYGEEFEPHLPKFVAAVWQLLTSIGLELKYDLLVSTALSFLGSVAEQTGNNKLFSEGEALKTICEQVIMPNVGFRAQDEELFNDNPEEWIRRDLEGSDQATRRRAACDLIRSLSRTFESQITDIFGGHINGALESYKADNSQWKLKEAAIFLVASLGTKKKTERHGVTETSSILPVVQFWEQYIECDLTSRKPALASACLKFLSSFRLIIGRERIGKALPQLSKLLTNESPVVAAYAAHALERIMMTKLPKTKEHLCTKDLVTPVQSDLLIQLGKIVATSENEFAAKALCRLLALQRELLMSSIPDLVQMLHSRLTQLCVTPARPNFNHNVFECLALCIRILCASQPSAVKSFEDSLFPLFFQVLEKDVGEIVPYVFQIMSLLLHQQGGCPDTYLEMYKPLLSPQLWEASGNVQPLVTLICAVIERCPSKPAEKLDPLLGVFQKLIASRSNDVHGFVLLKAIVCYLPVKCLDEYMRSIFLVLFGRLQSSKTAKYAAAFVEFLSCYAAKHGTEKLRDITNTIQPGCFSMLCEKVVTQHIRKVRLPADRKMAGVFAADILTKGGIAPDLWGALLQEVIALFELPVEDLEDDSGEPLLEGYSNATAILTFAAKTEIDPLKENCPDPKNYLVQTLDKLNRANPGQLSPIIAKLDVEALSHLKQYLATANIVL